MRRRTVVALLAALLLFASAAAEMVSASASLNGAFLIGLLVGSGGALTLSIACGGRP